MDGARQLTARRYGRRALDWARDFVTALGIVVGHLVLAQNRAINRARFGAVRTAIFVGYVSLAVWVVLAVTIAGALTTNF